MERRGGDGQVHSLSAACDLLHLEGLKHSGCLHLWTKHCFGGGGHQVPPPLSSEDARPWSGASSRPAARPLPPSPDHLEAGGQAGPLPSWELAAYTLPTGQGSSLWQKSSSLPVVPGPAGRGQRRDRGRDSVGSLRTASRSSPRPPAPLSAAGVSPVSLPALAGSLAGPAEPSRDGLRSASEARPQQARFSPRVPPPLTPGYSEIPASGKGGFTAVMEVTSQRPSDAEIIPRLS